jgi:hypothetical protein
MATMWGPYPGRPAGQRSQPGHDVRDKEGGERRPCPGDGRRRAAPDGLGEADNRGCREHPAREHPSPRAEAPRRQAAGTAP